MRDRTDRLLMLEDQKRAESTVCSFMRKLDLRQWNDIPGFFEDQVFLDYTSVRPEPPAGFVDKTAMIATWRQRYETVAAYQHALGNIVSEINGDDAQFYAASIVTHKRTTASGGHELWQAGNYHDVRLRRHRDTGSWLIWRMAVTLLWDHASPLPA